MFDADKTRMILGYRTVKKNYDNKLFSSIPGTSWTDRQYCCVLMRDKNRNTVLTS